MDLADEPLLAKIKPAPANIMFLLDDSSSMTFEVLIKGTYEGRYPHPENGSEESGYFYVFDYLNDGAPADSSGYMGIEDRKLWRSQYFDQNFIYYDPHVSYEPWPVYPGLKLISANKDQPKSHPIKKGAQTLNLDEESYTIDLIRPDGTASNLIVKHAHFFVTSEQGRPYLVVIDGERRKILYYRVVEVEGSGFNQKVTKVEEVRSNELDEGLASKRSYDEERQNFANWFTFHRRRQYVAINSIGRVIKKLKGVRVGILGINGNIIVPLKPVNLWKDGVFFDKTSELLKELYAYGANGDTPLREGLNDVGRYYKNNLKILEHHRGNRVDGTEPPYYSDADGGACQQSFTVIMTDGYYSIDKNDLRVGNADGDNRSEYDGDFYADDLEETLADVAMYYYENDLSPILADRVYDSQRLQRRTADTAPHQHMSTYGIAFGVNGNIDPNHFGTDWSSEDYLKDFFGDYPVWPSSITIRSKDTVDDLFHATVNGRGQFFSATNPEHLADALNHIVRNITSRKGSSASVSTNRDSLFGKISEEALMFQCSYDTNGWSGNVIAYRFDIQSGEALMNDPKWIAADSLRLKPWDQRNILSYDGSFGIQFNENDVTEDQKLILGSDFENIIDFVRGRDDIENFRVRTSLLGDIVHSSPVFEAGVIYVGANDGMLHAFEITIGENKEVSGEEIFAYVPSMVFENLSSLTKTDYAHKYFVDLSPTTRMGNGLLGGDDSKTLLVGGLGKGGKGYFALDITNPKSMTSDDVLWEFPAGTDLDMGFSFSKPVIVRSNDDQNSWVVIFGNGYDSSSGKAILYILNPSRRPGEGLLIKKFDLGGEPDNGLSSPVAVDVNFDKKVDFVYAGDLYGNLWKFDLTGDSSAEWEVAYSDGAYVQPLFQALGPDGSPQPITSKPEVMFHPKAHGLMVLFGTGKFLENKDHTEKRPQTVYGIWDYGDRNFYRGEWGDFSNDDNTEYLGSFTRPQLSNQPDNVTLIEQTSNLFTIPIFDKNNVPANINVRVLSDIEPIWNQKTDSDLKGPNGEPSLPDLAADGTSHAGWFWDLPLAGERVVSDVLLRDGRLIVIGFTPNPDRCGDGGTSFLMVLNAFTGGNAGKALIDMNGDGKINEKDLVLVELDDNDNQINAYLSGLQLPGNLQFPSILQIDNKIEAVLLSSSTGEIYNLREKAPRLGITYWKELLQ
jgi:type IV pilus assembly protein PilY1